ncbi:MAG: M20 family metallopeptidase [Acidimicrobiales bacterium]
MRDLVDIARVVELTSAMVAVDTSNPPGREGPIAEVVRGALERWKPEWKQLEPEPGRVSLVAEIPHPEGNRQRPRLMINGHLDVVPARPDDWSRSPFEPAVVDGRLYGRGSADMKGGIAAAICALEVLERAGRPPGCDVVFHLVADEEVGGRLGTKALLDAGLIVGDACLIPEPTGMQLCIAERGLYQGHVRVHGVPGHGSRPREGVSAIEHAARLVLALHGADFGGETHPLLGQPSANVGTIEGGNGLNVIAESCRFGVDRRVLPGATAESTEAELRSRIEGAGVDGLRYDLDMTIFGEASELDRDHDWAGAVADAVLAGAGRKPDVIGMPFTTDARFVRNQRCIPAVVCGPGEIAQAHVVDEWVSLDALVDATASYAELIAAFCTVTA